MTNQKHFRKGTWLMISLSLLAPLVFVACGLTKDYFDPGATVRVIDAVTGEPVAGAFMKYHKVFEPIMPDLNPVHGFSRVYYAKTNQQGMIEVPPLTLRQKVVGCSPNVTWVVVFKPGYHPADITVPAYVEDPPADPDAPLEVPNKFARMPKDVKLRPFTPNVDPCKVLDDLGMTFSSARNTAFSDPDANPAVAREAEGAVMEFEEKVVKVHACTKARELMDQLSRGKLGDLAFIKEHPEALNMANDEGETALHLAARKNDVHLAEELIKMGADVNWGKGKKYTPLHVATNHGNLEMVKLLISHGADVNAKNGDGEPPLFLTRISMFKHGEKQQKGWETFRYLLDNGADPNATNKLGTTMLYSVALGGFSEEDKEIALILLSYGADVNKGEEEETPLRRCLRNSGPEEKNCVLFFLEQGAEVKEGYLEFTDDPQLKQILADHLPKK